MSGSEPPERAYRKEHISELEAALKEQGTGTDAK
jgi:hypothetical protein